MVNSTKLLFSIPNSKKWTDSLSNIRAAPDSIIEVKEISGQWPKRWNHIDSHGKMQLQIARKKYIGSAAAANASA